MSTARPPLDLNDFLASVSPSLARYERGIRILSLDGGGIRGLVLIEQLIALEDAIKPAKISEFFDIICGTSTGGILALAIGIINKSLRDCKELYLNMATKIFGNPRKVPIPSQHDAAILEQVLQQEDNFGQRSLNEFTTSPKVFVVTALTNANNPMAYLFRNYANGGSNYTGTSNAKLWEAARASSAAPVYFQPFVKGDQCFVDGGIIANNPSFIAMAEARALWPNKEIDTIVSLGTGRSHLPDPTSVSGIIPKLIASGNQLLSSSDNVVAQGASAMLTISQLIIFFKMLIELTTDSEETHNTINTVNLLLKRTINYFRFNPNISFVALDCSDMTTLDKMIHETKQYLAQQKSKLQLLADIQTNKNCF